MNISGPAAVAKPEMLFYAPGDLTVTILRSEPYHRLSFDLDAQIIRTHKANSICFRVTINKALRH